MSKVEYGLAVYDRISGTIYEVMHMGLGRDPIDVQSVPHLLQEAGERGWELCGTMPGSTKGNSTPDPASETGKLRKVEDYNETTLLILKKCY
jgi:hypothetical protein